MFSGKLESTKKLWKGNQAMAEAALRAGCRYYFGYPITPQNDFLEYMADNLPARGGQFVQAESEVAAINMVYGAAAAGGRVMTSSSGPGISLMQEGFSMMAGANLPCVVVYISRGGPGVGTIAPAQSDYFQVTRGGGHGDYRHIVLAPSTLQEAVEDTFRAFELAESYRMSVIIYADAVLGQMMETVAMPERITEKLPDRNWAVSGNAVARGRRNIVTAYWEDAQSCYQSNLQTQAKYRQISQSEAGYLYEQNDDDPEYLLVAYGTTARICRKALKNAKAEGLKVGLFVPRTLWPFPGEALSGQAAGKKGVVVAEMSLGQLLDDVRLACGHSVPVSLAGFPGGVTPQSGQLLEVLRQMAGGELRRE